MTSVTIREATEADVFAIRAAHRRSIVELASADYSPEIIDEWGTDQSPEAIQRHKDSILSGEQLVWVAVVNGFVEGFSALIPNRNELIAVYVTGAIAKQGVGKSLLLALENKARELGLKKLELNSSITAKSFYEKNGYRNLGKGFHTMRSGRKMDCYVMEKDLKT